MSTPALRSMSMPAPNSSLTAEGPRIRDASPRRRLPPGRQPALLIGLIAVLLLGSMSLASADEADPPLAPPIEFDAGGVYPGAIISHEFAIENHDAAAWTVLKALTTCSCTVVGATAAMIPAGGRLMVPVAFNPGTKVGYHASSTVRVRIRRDGQVVDLPLIMEATPEIPVTGPERIALSTQAPRASFVIRRGRHPAAWNQVRARLVSGGDALRIEDQAAEGDGWRVTIALDAPGWSGVLFGRIALECQLDGQPLPYQPDLTVVARLDGPVRSSPASVLFSAIPSGKTAEVQVRIEGLNLSTATTTTSDERCHALLDAPAGSLTMTFSATGPAESANGWVDVIAGSAHLRIPYIAAVVRGAAAP